VDVAWRTFRRCLLGNRGPTLSERKKKREIVVSLQEGKDESAEERDRKKKETQREIFKLFLRGKKEEEECSEKKLEIFQKKGRKDERKSRMCGRKEERQIREREEERERERV